LMTIALAEVISRALESRLADVFTAVPCEVVTYYPETQTADLLPVVRRPVPTEEEDIAFEDLPIVQNIPIIFPRGKSVSITWPLEKGDGVLLCSLTFCANEWRRTGEITDPLDIRLHSLGNAFAIPGAFPDVKALDAGLASAPGLTLTAEQIALGSHKATAPVALAPAVKAWLDALKTEIEALKGGVPVVVPIEYPTTSTVASAKGKAE